MIIQVGHEVPYDKGKEMRCVYDDGDFWGHSVCKHHATRNRYHGNKAPTEFHKPHCKLFHVWLDEPYKKCEQCLRHCQAEMDGGAEDA